VIVLISLIIPLVYLQLLQIHQGFLSRFSPTFAGNQGFLLIIFSKNPDPTKMALAMTMAVRIGTWRPGISGYLLALL